jgi:hypothetical protein
MITQLIKLRYLLLWAQIRGKQSSFLVFGILILFVALWELNSGFVGIYVGLLLSREMISVRAIHFVFWILYAASIALTVVTWARPQAAFSDPTLRRYPISPKTRFLARHVIGLLDPLWLTVILFTVGLLTILVLKESIAPINGLICALFFISVSYLSAALLLALLQRAAWHPRSASLIGMAAVAVFTAAGITVPFLKSPASLFSWPALDFLPPAAAAHLLFEDSALAFVCYGVILAGWCYLFARLLKRMEAAHPSNSRRRSGKVEATIARFLSFFFGKAWSPLVERSLLYHLRCDRIRVNLGIAILAIPLMLHFLDRSQNIPEMLMIRAALLFVSGLFSVSNMMFNSYGYDGSGMARLALCPVPFATTLISASLASLLLSFVVGSASSSVVLSTMGFSIDPSTLVIFVSSAWAGAFFLATLGLFSSIYFPKQAHYDKIFGSDSSTGTQGIVCAVIFFTLMAAIRLASIFDASGPVQFWWAFPVLLAFCVYLYLFSLKWIGRLLAHRREDLLRNFCNT